MKRTILFLLLVSCIAAFVPAHGNNPGQQRRNNDSRSSAENRHGRSWDRQGSSRNQSPGRQRQSESRDARPSREAESVSISGNLTLVQGRIALNSGGTTYIIGGLHRHVGFIDGLREGAAVTIEGNAFAVPDNENAKFLLVQKLTIGGNDYDLAPNFTRPRQNTPQNRPPQNQRRRR